jgi:hypothetical protein
MKRNLNIWSAAVLLLAVAITGCSREEKTNNGLTEPAVVLVKLVSANPETKAVAAPETGAPATLSSGYVVFTNNSGIITKKFTIVTTTTTGSNVNNDDLGNGVTLTVPAGTKNVYVFGNPPSGSYSGANYDEGKSVTNFTSLEVTVANLYSAGTTDAVPFYGDGTIVNLGGTYEAEVSIYPIAGRIEIDKITGDAADFKSFKVKRVVINNYYPSRAINGGGSTAALNHGTATASGHVYETPGSTYYKSADLGQLHDEPALVASDVNSPPFAENASTNVFAYTLPAPVPEVTYFPHILIELEDIEVIGADAAFESGTWWLTIKNAVPTGTTNPTVSDYVKFNRGKVYTLDVNFTADLLTEFPEQTNINVLVEVTVEDWVIVPVAPVF